MYFNDTYVLFVYVSVSATRGPSGVLTRDYDYPKRHATRLDASSARERALRLTVVNENGDINRTARGCGQRGHVSF